MKGMQPYFETDNGKLYYGEALETLRKLPDNLANTCVTSPPYFGLRDYGTAEWIGGDDNCDHNPQVADGGQRSDRTVPLGRGGMYKDVCLKCGATREDNQVGLEDTPELYVERLVDIFREVKRVLKDDGTLWLNLGDSYANTGGKSQPQPDSSGGVGNKKLGTRGKQGSSASYGGVERTNTVGNGLKPKDLIGIPWMVAFALRADGWYLRQDIIWHKPNPMPESVTDRCTKAHEYIFLLSKNKKYYYDNESIKEDAKPDGKKDTRMKDSKKYSDDNYMPNNSGPTMASSGHERWQYDENGVAKKNKRSVWTVATKPFTGSHFATFPKALIEPCVLAGCPKGGVVLDIFSGASTTWLVAEDHFRKFVGIELGDHNCEISKNRIEEHLFQTKFNFGER